jgi:hypothetical protein
MADTHFTGVDAGTLKVDGVSVLATQGAAIADHVITWTANAPTADDAATVDDGNTVGDDNDAGDCIQNINTKLNLVLAALRANGIIAT